MIGPSQRGLHRLLLALWGAWVLGWTLYIGAAFVVIDVYRDLFLLWRHGEASGAEATTAALQVAGTALYALCSGWPITPHGWAFMWLWGWPALLYAGTFLALRVGRWVAAGFNS